MGDMIFGMDLDDDDEFDMEIAASQDSATARGSLFQSGTASTKQRLRVGPPQNSDTKALQRIPPQVHLLRIERMLHKISGCMALEQVHPPPGYGEPETAAESAGSGSKNDAVENMKKKRPQLDEFDKKLGLQSRSANPVTRIASTFLGPLMRIIRILIFLVRISFNVSTWRDPYLSFWTFIALSLLCVFLIWFPWRAFFLVAIFASVGPQVSILSVLSRVDLQHQFLTPGLELVSPLVSGEEGRKEEKTEGGGGSRPRDSPQGCVWLRNCRAVVGTGSKCVCHIDP